MFYAALAAYLLGSISFAVIASWLFGLPDPRTYGSKNPGATNVLRSGKKLAALVTLLGDGGKGWLAVFLVGHFGVGVNETTLALAGLAVLLGHFFPVFFRFQGGKGVATAAGVLLAFDPWLGLAVIATWLGVAGVFRISSLAALTASLLAPLWCGWLLGWQQPYTLATVFIGTLLIWRHHTNIRKLLRGEEGRIGEKSQSAQPPVDTGQ